MECSSRFAVALKDIAMSLQLHICPQGEECAGQDSPARALGTYFIVYLLSFCGRWRPVQLSTTLSSWYLRLLLRQSQQVESFGQEVDGAKNTVQNNIQCICLKDAEGISVVDRTPKSKLLSSPELDEFF